MWIEIVLTDKLLYDQSASLPARGVWIEIAIAANIACASQVTPREGSVD